MHRFEDFNRRAPAVLTHLVSYYRVSAQSDEYCRLWIDLKISSTPSERKTKKIRLRAIVRTDIYYHPTKIRHNRIRTVGCKSIWRYQEARPHNALWEEMKKSGLERLCGLTCTIILSCSAQSNKNCRLRIERCGSSRTDVRTRVSFYKVIWKERKKGKTDILQSVQYRPNKFQIHIYRFKNGAKARGGHFSDGTNRRVDRENSIM